MVTFRSGESSRQRDEIAYDTELSMQFIADKNCAPFEISLMTSSHEVLHPLPPLLHRYLLSVCVPLTVDRHGRHWADPLWAKDLALHLPYLENLTLSCPVRLGQPSEEDISLDQPPFDRLKIVSFPLPNSSIEVLIGLANRVRKTWSAIKGADIVHTGFGGWPITEAWLDVPIAKAHRKFTVVNVENSMWRGKGYAGWRAKVVGALAERINRFCVRSADLCFFTSTAYRDEFLGPHSNAGHVTPASWIDENRILTDTEAEKIWANKIGRVRVAVVARLVPEKGLGVLLACLSNYSNELINLDLTIVGDGPLKSEWIEFLRTYSGPVTVRLQTPLAYGDRFFKYIQSFDAIIVPSVSDEQPRIILDAFSQAIPILGSSTGGIRELVVHNENGRLFRPNDPQSLYNILSWAAQNRPSLRKFGMSALKLSRGRTHENMHAERHVILCRALDLDRQA